MKYSIKGNLAISDGSGVVEILNKYNLWRLVTNNYKDAITNVEYFTFEAWVDTEAEKTNLFNELKPIVDVNGELINWHECTHDEEVQQPCVIAEEYRGS